MKTENLPELTPFLEAFNDPCHYDPTVLARFAEIFPNEQSLEFHAGESHYLVVDHYCKNPTCKCTDVVIEIADVATEKTIFSEFYNFQTKKFSLTKKVPENFKELEANVKAMSEQMKQRSGLIKKAYADFLATDPYNLLKKPVLKKYGTNRNEPCSCGSGKKYKKCCGK